MKIIYFLNKIRSHLITIAPVTPFTPKSTSKLRYALHFRYLIVIPWSCFIFYLSVIPILIITIVEEP